MVDFTREEILAKVAAGESLAGVDLSGANLSGEKLRGADLSGANLSRANLSGTDIIHANMRRANLTGADLRRAYLLDADLREADLTDAVLNDAKLHGTYFVGANLSGADLSEADLTSADLTSADLTSADLSKADLSKARNDTNTKWPEGFDPEAAGAARGDVAKEERLDIKGIFFKLPDLIIPLIVLPIAYLLYPIAYLHDALWPASDTATPSARERLSVVGRQRRRKIPLSARHRVFRNAENRCQQCGKSAADGVKLEVDHIMPVSRGGSNDISNLQLLCFECNRGKSDRVD